MAPTMDLNADLGEECGDDEALLDVITTANVATGAHAGGGRVLAATVAAAVARGVSVGAHPSYPDRDGFGRVSMADVVDMTALAQSVAEQVLDVDRECARNGVALSHVKVHGALYHDAALREPVARAVLAGVAAAAQARGGPGPSIMGMPGTVLHRVAVEERWSFTAEGFADRAYATDGTLVPRHAQGSVHVDVDVICTQAVGLALSSSVIAVDGTRIDVPVSTICLHGDTPGAVDHARAVRAALEGRGILITAARARA